jgi:hypothetical protein
MRASDGMNGMALLNGVPILNDILECSVVTAELSGSAAHLSDLR